MQVTQAQSGLTNQPRMLGNIAITQPGFKASLKNEPFNAEKDSQDITAIAPFETGWRGSKIYAHNSKEPIAWYKQKEDSPIGVEMKNGRGITAIVTTPNARYFGLPGSIMHFPDSTVAMNGKKLTGIESKVFDIKPPVVPQTVTDQAFLLCGGIGSRFEPLAGEWTGLAKPSAPLIGDDSIATAAIRHMAQHGIRHIVVHTYFLRNKVKHQIDELKKELKGVNIVYFDDAWASGNAAGFLKALQRGYLDRKKPTLIMSGDAVTNMDLTALLNSHKERGSGVTIASKKVADEDVKLFGIMRTSDESGEKSGEIKEFLEKPSLEKAGKNRLASTGIYVLSPEAYDYLEEVGNKVRSKIDSKGQKAVYDYGMHFMPNWLGLKAKNQSPAKGIHMWAEVINGYWMDAGNPTDYMRCLHDIAEGRLGTAAAERLKRDNFEDGVMYWPGTKQLAERDRAVLRGNIIVAPLPETHLPVLTRTALDLNQVNGNGNHLAQPPVTQPVKQQPPGKQLDSAA